MAAEGLSRFTYLVVDRSPVGGVPLGEVLLLTGKIMLLLESGVSRVVWVTSECSCVFILITYHTPLGRVGDLTGGRVDLLPPLKI